MASSLKALLYKTVITRKRHWAITILELLLPIVMFFLLTYSRTKIAGFKKEFVPMKNGERYTLDEIYAKIIHDDFNLWYAPDNQFTKRIIEEAAEILQLPSEVRIGFVNKEKLLNGHPGNASTIAGIIFDTSNPKQLTYDLRMYTKDGQSWDTNKLYVPTINDVSTNSYDNSKYITYGFIALQMATNLAFIKINGFEDINIDFQLQQYPIPAHTVDNGFNLLFKELLPLITVFSFIFQCPAIIARICEENQSGVKEYMKMVGIGTSIQWFSWIIYILLTNLISIFVVVIFMTVEIPNVTYPLMDHTNYFIMFVTLLLYTLVCAAIYHTFATISTNVTSAMSSGLIFSVSSYFIPSFIETYLQNPSFWTKVTLALFPNTALNYAYKAIFYCELQEEGAQWNNLLQSCTASKNHISLGVIFIIFGVEFIFLSLFSIYIDIIKPGFYGISKPVYYPLWKLYTFIKFIRNKPKPLNNCEEGQPMNDNKISVEFENVYKLFNEKEAVENLNWKIEQDEITVLLGTNGAGKTTAISMIAGLIGATSGRVLINGKDIKWYQEEVCQDIGLCTQHDLLFSDFTVKEHLIFFAKLKGKDTEDNIDEMLKQLNLYDKANFRIGELSGGMKRKLCLGIALIGDPKILLLDEPTSGVDKEGRLSLVKLLNNQKLNKIILITTHHLDNVEEFADSITIMNGGRKITSGTLENIKKNYNTGYNLTIQFKDYIRLKVKDEISTLLNIESDKIKILLNDEANKILILLISLKEQKYFPKLLQELEDDKTISNIKLSLTSLEEVFHRVITEKTEIINYDLEEKVTKYLDSLSEIKSQPKTKPSIWRTLFNKKLSHFKKLVFLFIIPIIAMISSFIIAIFFGKGVEFYQLESNSFELTLNPYSDSVVYYITDKLNATDRFKAVYQGLVQTQKGELKTAKDIDEVLKEFLKDPKQYEQVIAGTEFNRLDDVFNVTTFYSTNAIHSIPISVNLAMDAILKNLKNDNYGINAFMEPLELRIAEQSKSEISEFETVALWMIFIPMGMIMFNSFVILFPYFEISSKFIEIQLMSGVSRFHYWVSNVIIDLLFAIIVISSISTIFLFTLSFEEYGVLLIILLTYFICALPTTYLFSYSKSLQNGVSRYMIISTLVGLILTIILLVVKQSNDNPIVAKVLEVIEQIFYLSPSFSLYSSIVNFTRIFVQNYNWNVMSSEKISYLCSIEETRFKYPCCNANSYECKIQQDYINNKEFGIWLHLVPKALYSPAFFLTCTIIWWIKCKVVFKRNCFKKCHCSHKSDFPEYKSNTLFKVANLSLCAPKSPLVTDVSFYVDKNKCLGLLGINGSGKTSTLKMVVNETQEHFGKITMDNNSDVNLFLKIFNKKRYLSKVGYCPQINSLNYIMTGYDILHLLALLKGYSDKNAKTVATSLLNMFYLEKHQNKSIITYSGGTKRKLCTCLALLASPELIILDEPTTGVDPASSLTIRKTLKMVKEKLGSRIILCSHSWQEVEQLCDDIVVLKKGEIISRGTLDKMLKENDFDYKIILKHNLFDQEMIDKFQADLKRKQIKYDQSYKQNEQKDVYISISSEGSLSQLISNLSEIDNYVKILITTTSLQDVFKKICTE